MIEQSETSTGTKEERRRETSTGTPAGTRRSQQIMREQRPFLARIETPFSSRAVWGNIIYIYICLKTKHRKRWRDMCERCVHVLICVTCVFSFSKPVTKRMPSPVPRGFQGLQIETLSSAISKMVG